MLNANLLKSQSNKQIINKKHKINSETEAQGIRSGSIQHSSKAMSKVQKQGTEQNTN